MNKTTILIVEDEAIIAMDLAGKLGFQGYEVVGTARCGEEAIEMACRLHPRVVLMDIRLKGEMDGIETAGAIHRQMDVPVIYLTAHTDAATLERIKPTGPYGFILKPFEERDISATIEMALYKHRADRQLRESEERYRNVVENTTAIILRVNPDGVINFANGQALRFFGYTADELIGKHAVKTIVPEKETGGRDLVSLISEIIADPDRFHTNANENICKDGRRVWIEWTNSGIYDAAGRLKEFLAVGIDATERKRAEESATAAHRQLQSIIDNTPAVVYAFDLEERFVMANAALAEMLGSTPEQMIGRRRYEFMPKEDADWHEANDRRVIEAGRAMAFEEHSRLQGCSITWLTTKFPLRDAQGRIYAVAGISSDMTVRKQMEEALRAAELEKTLILDSANEIIAYHDTDNCLVWANMAYLRALGIQLSELKGKKCYKCWGLDQLCGNCPVIRAVATGQPQEGELTPENQPHWPADRGSWIIRAAPVKDCTGKVIGAIEMAHDITQRKRAEEALRQRSEELQTLLDTTPIPIFIAHDPECRKITGNPAVQQLVGLPADANVSKSAPAAERPTQWREMRDGAMLKPEDLPLQRAARGEEIRDYEMDLVFEDGTVKSVVGNATPIRDKHGKPQGGVAILMDITERKRAEESLRKAYTEMEEQVTERTRELRDKDQLLIMQSRQAAMGEMMGNIAHQWRQPLNNVGLIMQTLTLMHDTGQLNGENLAALENQVMDLVRHMSRTIDDFRHFFRPDKQKTTFPVREAVERSVALVEASFRDKCISTEINMEEDAVITGFPNEYSQAVLNILHNSRDAFDLQKVPDPRVIIVVRKEKGKSVVTISDNAGGIPGDFIYKVFDPYFTTKGPDKGTGVGLFMSKSIIEKNMGGKLTVRNTGSGAEFRIEV